MDNHANCTWLVGAVNSSTCNETYSQLGPTPLEYYTDLILGVALSLLTMIGLIANISVIVLFTKNKSLRTRNTQLLRSLAWSDGIMAFVGGCMFTLNCFNHQWIFGEKGCTLYGMIMYWCGVTSIAHLCAISVERCVTIANPSWSLANRKKIPVHIDIMIACCWLYGLFMAILPLVGVQSYVIEGRVSCSIKWYNIDKWSTFYNILIFSGSFIFPAAIIVSTNLVIFCIVKRSFNRQSIGRCHRSVENRKTEFKLARTMITAAACYLTAWAPYAVLCMWASFGDASTIPPILFTWLGFMAKLSFMFDPIVYIFTNSQYRKELSKLLLRRHVTKLEKFNHRRAVSPTSNRTGQQSKFLATNEFGGKDSSSGGTYQMSLTSYISPQPSANTKSKAENKLSHYTSINEEHISLVQTSQ